MAEQYMGWECPIGMSSSMVLSQLMLMSGPHPPRGARSYGSGRRICAIPCFKGIFNMKGADESDDIPDFFK